MSKTASFVVEANGGTRSRPMRPSRLTCPSKRPSVPTTARLSPPLPSRCRVESRDRIIPTFRLPTTSVCVTDSMVGRSCRNAHHDLAVVGERIAL